MAKYLEVQNKRLETIIDDEQTRIILMRSGSLGSFIVTTNDYITQTYRTNDQAYANAPITGRVWGILVANIYLSEEEVFAAFKAGNLPNVALCSEIIDKKLRVYLYITAQGSNYGSDFNAAINTIINSITVYIYGTQINKSARLTGLECFNSLGQCIYSTKYKPLDIIANSKTKKAITSVPTNNLTDKFNIFTNINNNECAVITNSSIKGLARLSNANMFPTNAVYGVEFTQGNIFLRLCFAYTYLPIEESLVKWFPTTNYWGQNLLIRV